MTNSNKEQIVSFHVFDNDERLTHIDNNCPGLLKWVSSLKEARDDDEKHLTELTLDNLRKISEVISAIDVNSHLNFYERNDDKNLMDLSDLHKDIKRCITQVRRGNTVFAEIK